jgi:Toprim domain
MTAAADIARALATRIEALCAALLPNGRREGAEWRCGSIHGEPGHSLAVRLYGAKAGMWKDFATDDAGDALDLVAATLDLTIKDALQWARDWLGGAAPEIRSPAAASDDRADKAAHIEIARQTWRQAVSVAGTPGFRYLRDWRCIDLETVPATIRFHPRLVYGPKREGVTFPGIVCLVQDAAGGFRGIWRIFLDPTTHNKAPVESPRKGLGDIARAAVHLTPAGEEIIICEGVETGLAVLCADPARMCWAGLSATLMRRVVLPAQVRRVVLLEENDRPDALGRRASPDAVRALAQRFLGEGREVRVARPPRQFKDYNDWLMSGRERDAA